MKYITTALTILYLACAIWGMHLVFNENSVFGSLAFAMSYGQLISLRAEDKIQKLKEEIQTLRIRGF